ncbi:hypothetical protein ASPZODRAFT_71603 [Penicilliopsis zonata CBS 506.65]|uniref:Ketoreductase (KR) domain-containing protein n=1 Tax=Penicilliopsis zonata CBS 506.65 TaxID=1073090 RepID=A0A1L9SBC3_9EURO|nr:hypothetical protein ASPZODRAFT_71603 [Penicilliopsis zonata CBS 506.65]OJJ44436.1 hypothetical protein ASPZODRAFT_71603 [Penicilliopsis zonata CBS 506.65]
MAKLSNKRILVIGGTSGIGLAVAKASLETCAKVTIASSSPERVTSTVESLKAEFPHASITGHACDLSSETVEAEIESLFEKVGTVDHIVYTAGDKIAATPVEEITREKIIAAGQLRFIAPMLVTAKVASSMKRSDRSPYLSPGPDSSITLTTGTAWERPVPFWTITASYLGGVGSMARNLALELRPVRVNVVSPGLVDTELWDALLSEEQKGELFQEVKAKNPTGRVARPEDVAEAYLYLMRDVNITGRIISSDSGASLV